MSIRILNVIAVVLLLTITGCSDNPHGFPAPVERSSIVATDGYVSKRIAKFTVNFPNGASSETHYQYDAAGRILTRHYSKNDKKAMRRYVSDDHGRISHVYLDRDGDGTDDVIAYYEYENDRGLVRQASKLIDGQFVSVREFEFQNGQMVQDRLVDIEDVDSFDEIDLSSGPVVKRYEYQYQHGVVSSRSMFDGLDAEPMGTVHYFYNLDGTLHSTQRVNPDGELLNSVTVVYEEGHCTRNTFNSAYFHHCVTIPNQ